MCPEGWAHGIFFLFLDYILFYSLLLLIGLADSVSMMSLFEGVCADLPVMRLLLVLFRRALRTMCKAYSCSSTSLPMR